MKIDNNTTSSDVKEKTKTALVRMDSIDENKNNGENISEGIRKIFDEIRNQSGEYGLDDEVAKRLIELQEMINSERKKYMSIEELIKFLNSAMNYGEFQIWLLNNQLESIELSPNDKIKKFLSENSNANILTLYDIECNYDDNNIESISKNIDKEINESTSKSGKKSIKKLVKTIMNVRKK